MKKIQLIILLSISLLSFGQNDSIKKRGINLMVHKIDSLSTKSVDNFDLKIDSINVNIKRYSNKIETENLFLNSNSKLFISYYFNDSKLIMVRAKEQSPIMDDLFNYTVFYYENEKVFAKRYYQNIRICELIPKKTSIYELYGYNKELNEVFLRSYFDKLYNIIKK